jgi:murein DD-endopeptidase MepM/ murein hydrolase activator NlpD
MNKLTKRKIGIKRKEMFNKKLAIQVGFSIILVALVILTKQMDSSFSKQFISVTEEKLSENIDPSTITGAFKNVVIGVRDKIPFLSKKDNEYTAPVDGKIYKEYGLSEEDNTSYYNHGVDIISNTQAVKSISEGTVVLVGNNEKLSNYVVVQERDKKIIYGKINETLVSKGDQISKGDIIGALSEDGKILHLEVWENGESLNPSKLFEISD